MMLCSIGMIFIVVCLIILTHRNENLDERVEKLEGKYEVND